MIIRTCVFGKCISARLLQCRSLLGMKITGAPLSSPVRSFTAFTVISKRNCHSAGVKLESWSFDVDTFSALRVNSDLKVTVSPTDPIAHPEANKVFVYVTGTGNASQNVSKQDDPDDDGQGDPSTEAEMYKCDVKYDKIDGLKVSANGLRGEDYNRRLNLQIQIEVPIKFNIDAHMSENGQIHVIGIENDHCTIVTDKGECKLTNIKCASLTVSSVSGNVISEKSLHSNGEIRVHGSGSVMADKLYGTNMAVYSDRGMISTKSVYHDESFFASMSGNISLGNLHGSSHVRNDTGNVIVDTLDGNLNASTHSGNIGIHVTRHQDVTLLSSTGDITVKLPESTGSRMDLQGRTVDVDDRLEVITEQGDKTLTCQTLKGIIGDGDSRLLTVSTQGSVQLQCLSWFDNLNLSKS